MVHLLLLTPQHYIAVLAFTNYSGEATCGVISARLMTDGGAILCWFRRAKGSYVALHFDTCHVAAFVPSDPPESRTLKAPLPKCKTELAIMPALSGRRVIASTNARKQLHLRF